jgi:2-phosphosulfolactate phosphatase
VNIHFCSLEDPVRESDTAVVIDVLRAFSTAAYAFSRGASALYLVRRIEEAFAVHSRLPDSLLTGENEGIMVPGFHFGNSPAEMLSADVNGRSLVQRTTAGTRGMVQYSGVRRLYAASFVCASATARDILRQPPDSITFVSTGKRSGVDGDEDLACAEFLAALLSGERPNVEPYLRRVRSSSWGRQFGDPNKPQFPLRDLELCEVADVFDFSMTATQERGSCVLRPQPSARAEA